MNGFWHGGRAAFERGNREERRRLERERDASNDDERRREIERELERLRKQGRDADGNLH